MLLTTQLITSKSQWEKFLLSKPEASFLQSWNWGEFHVSLGKNIFRIALMQDQTFLGAALCIKEQAKRGTYLTIAGGPIVDWNNKTHLTTLNNAIKLLAKKEKCLFIRMRPQAIDTSDLRTKVHKNGWKRSPMHLTADLTLQLDLQLSEKEILTQMRKNTRYEIKKAQKLGINVKNSQDPKEITSFHKYQLELARKHHFVPFSYEFFHKQFLAFVQDNQVMLFHSYHQNKLLASAFVIFYNKEAVYHYGIST